MRKLIAAVALLGSLTACGSSSTAQPGGTVTVTPSQTATQPAASDVTPLSASMYPAGYRKVVTVSSLPEQVRNWYQMSDDKQAVAVPGVWAELKPGAVMQDALDAQVFDGFCSSIRAYPRKHLAGQDVAGSCW